MVSISFTEGETEAQRALGQGYTGGKRQSWDSNPGSLAQDLLLLMDSFLYYPAPLMILERYSQKSMYEKNIQYDLVLF